MAKKNKAAKKKPEFKEEAPAPTPDDASQVTGSADKADSVTALVEEQVRNSPDSLSPVSDASNVNGAAVRSIEASQGRCLQDDVAEGPGMLVEGNNQTEHSERIVDASASVTPLNGEPHFDEASGHDLVSSSPELRPQTEPQQDLTDDSAVGTDKASAQSVLLNTSTMVLSQRIQQLEGELQASRDEVRSQHSSIEELKSESEKLTEEKSQAESQYRSLFAKVTQMKSTLGARLKQDSEELAQNRTLIEQLESQNAALNETITHMQEQVVSSSETAAASLKDFGAAKDELEQLKRNLQRIESLRETEKLAHMATQEKCQIMAADWENLAFEERSTRDTLRDRIHDLEEQLSAQNTAYENLRSIVDQDNQSITKFKQNIYELQESHKAELRDAVESMQNTINQLSIEAKASEERATTSRLETQNLLGELEKFRPYEQEVKEKNLLIGKLRHEAVILNEHLTKALRLLKRGSSNDSVDRQLINNLLLSFFQLPRQDSKRFEVLKILSNVLSWDDIQKEQAGLIRPGSSNAFGQLSPSTTRSPPMSPNLNRSAMSRRTSGTVQLQAADFIGPNRESMSDLWINFLQTEAAMQAVDHVEES